MLGSSGAEGYNFVVDICSKLNKLPLEIKILVFLSIWSQREELKILIPKWQIAVISLKIDTPQDHHMLLGQVNLLKWKIKILEPIWDCFNMMLLKTGLFNFKFCLCARYSTIVGIALLTTWKSFPYPTVCCIVIAIKPFSEKISWRYCKKLLCFVNSLSLQTHWTHWTKSYLS